jgi:hypothetical protein
MPIYHVGESPGFLFSTVPLFPWWYIHSASPESNLSTRPVLFKLKPGVTPTQVAEWTTLAKAMVGKIPGLIKLEANTPLPATANRGQGFDMGLIAILEKAEDVKAYAEHPAHLE